MSTTATRSKDAAADARVGKIDLKLEVITVPVSDIDRAKEFYEGLGWRLDADFRHGEERAVQFTSPGSPCSIHFGKNAPGSAQGLFLVVSDIQAARGDLSSGTRIRYPIESDCPTVSWMTHTGGGHL